jgi:hypothetical protein
LDPRKHRSKGKKSKKKKEKKKGRKHSRRSHSSSDFQTFEGGSPVSPEDFEPGLVNPGSPITSNEDVSRSSWNNGPKPTTGPRTPPIAMRGARTPEGPGPRTPPSGGPRTPSGPRTPEGRGARTPDTPTEDDHLPMRNSSLQSSRNYNMNIRAVKRPSTPPEPYPEQPTRSSPVGMTMALENAYKAQKGPSKGPRTPPGFSPRGPVSPPGDPPMSPRAKGYGSSPPPNKRLRTGDRSSDRSRDRRSSSKRDRDRSDHRRAPSRSPPPRRPGRDSLDRSPGRRGSSRRSHSRSPSRSGSRRSSRRSSRDRYPMLSPRSEYRSARSERESGDRDYRKSNLIQTPEPERTANVSTTGNISNLQATSLFAEMIKNKKTRELLKQKNQRRSDQPVSSSVVVNSELSDPRNQLRLPGNQQPPASGLPPISGGGHRFLPANGQPMLTNAAGYPMQVASSMKKGAKPLPHRPGALPMPPGMEMARMMSSSDSG